MKLREKLSNKESSGVITLIFVILSIQTVVFLFSRDSKPQTIIDSREESAVPDNIKSQKNDSAVSEGQDKKPQVRAQIKPQITSQKRATPQYELFLFDPNIATIEEFVRLGLSEGQARVIERYRERGGVFRRREDFKKIYVLSEGFYERVEKYIVINPLDESNSHPPAKVAVRQVTDINRADSSDLIALPGIGPFYASRILNFRARVGGYLHAEQLLDIHGMDSSRFALFCDYITVDTAFVKKRDLSTLSVEELSHNPYIGSYKARAIIRLKELSNEGSIKLSDLIINNIINTELSKILNQYFH